jgi:nucleoid DNA-binding protein
LSRQKLIRQLKKKNPKINQSDIADIIDIFSENISKALKNGQNVEIRGLGRWYFKKLKENFNARNPATNELIYKPERTKLRFRASKKLNEIINK